jgi:pyridoxine/pyridoxamine 5'-phosphate oxidase
MTREALLEFMRSEKYAVQTSVSPNGIPQAAVVGIAVSDRFEIVFDTLASSRKAANLSANPAMALVIGGTRDGDERTVQYEGTADEPSGGELERLLALYYARFPDGRERRSWPGLIYVRVKPTWIRYSDFSVQPPEIIEFGPATWR